MSFMLFLYFGAGAGSTNLVWKSKIQQAIKLDARINIEYATTAAAAPPSRTSADRINQSVETQAP